MIVRRFVYFAAPLVLALYPLVVQSAPIVGRWDWTEPNPLENRANPGTYDATTLGGATATGGVATVWGPNDNLIELGGLTEKYNADRWSFTFDDVVLQEERAHILAGTLRPGFSPGSWGYVQASANNSGLASAVIRAWFDGNAGSSGAQYVTFSGLTIHTGTPYDFQYFFDNTRPAGSHAGFRMRDGADAVWGPIAWQGTLDFAMAGDEGSPYPMFLGKYHPGSTVYSNFSVGEVTFEAVDVPEPSTICLAVVSFAGLSLLPRRRRRQRSA